MPYYTVIGASYNCMECGKKSIAPYDEPAIIKICSVGPYGVKWIQEELIQKVA